jgi:CRP-like cAMP-binding protein
MVQPEILVKIPAFKAFSADEIKELSERLNIEEVEAQWAIFNENQIGDDSMYFILDGAVKIIKKTKSEEKVLANLKAGDFFGEMSMLQPAPRSASAVTIRPSKLVRLSDRDYNDFKKTRPAIVVKFNDIFISTLIQRLREADKRLVKEGFGIGAI